MVKFPFIFHVLMLVIYWFYNKMIFLKIQILHADLLSEWAICTMTTYNHDQNTLRFCFLGKLGLSLFKPRWDYQILNMKGKTKRNLVVLVK